MLTQMMGIRIDEIRVIFVSLVILLSGACIAQVPEGPEFDPSDVYFQAYLAVRGAEQLEKDEDFAGALKKYEQAAELFGSVGKFYPDWKSGMVRNRKELTEKAIVDVRVKAGEQIQKDQGVIAELEGGQKVGAVPMAPNDGPEEKGILEVDALQAKRLKEAEAEVARLRGMALERQAQLDAGQRRDEEVRAGDRDAKTNEEMRNASRVDDLRKLNESLQHKLKAAEDNAKLLRAQMAAAPVKTEIDALNKRIQNLDQEREAMAMALNASRGDHTKALSKIEILNADIKILQGQAEALRQKEANLGRDLEMERKVANEVVAGQRKQMAQFEKALEEKSGQLKAANDQITGLKLELDESREAFAELREERDHLLVERDQMAALLKLNEAGRIEQLIEQNMEMAKLLREANEKVERMNLDNNAAKDEVNDAKRDLAIAKSMINRLQQEKREQDNRIKELTNRLEQEEKALVNGEVRAADPAEVAMLREVIRRQLRVQERRRQAKELLLEAARDLGKEDERLNEAIAMFDLAEIELTPEEQKLVADQQVDGEFVSPIPRDRATVGLATVELNRELDSYDRAATKAYLAGRLLPTRELYELMIEQHPGHVPALCKLGIVQLKLNEPTEAAMSFQKAIELDEGNSYAMRMLGFCHLKLDDLAAADEYLRKAVELAPDDAKSYRLWGTVAYRLGAMDDAESHFKASISADPIPSEAYFNLAMLYLRKGRLDEARNLYSQALERGAVPDAMLEKQLTINE